MSKFKTYKFHSKFLLPEDIAREARDVSGAAKGLEVIYNWQERHQSTHRFKEGERVFHIDDLYKPMYVDKILKEYTEERPRMIGVQCHWFEERDKASLFI